MTARTVTDHAIRRAAERMSGLTGLPDDDMLALAEMAEIGFDIEGMRREIGKIVQRGVEAGAYAVRFRGVRFLIRDGVAVTVLEKWHGFYLRETR